jgi:XTP/dITP diphosphohydrolase
MPSVVRTLQQDNIVFASTNHNKYFEVKSILLSLNHGLIVDFVQAELTEVQSDSLEDIAKEKAKNAFAKVDRPVIVEDDGLFINILNGFPGPYSSYVLKTIGNTGILKLLSDLPSRSASFHSVIAFYDGKGLSIFEGRIDGKISDKITKGGWGYDPIFAPTGTNLTFAQLKDKKNEYSHRKRALEKFAQWYLKL